MRPVQVLISSPESSPLVATLPVSVRTAEKLTRERRIGAVFLTTGSAWFARTFRPLVERMGRVSIFGTEGPTLLPPGIDQEAPLLVLTAEGMPRNGAVASLVGSLGPQPIIWRWKGMEIGRYVPRASAWHGDESQASHETIEVPEDAWIGVRNSTDARRAERLLLSELSHDKDGYIARYDRRVSTAISRELVRSSITPSQITTLSLVVGLLGAWWLAAAARSTQLAGIVLLWFSCILDGCDGEVARIKFQCTDAGARYDLIADHFCHAATFGAVIVHVIQARPDAHWLWPVSTLLSGVAACMAAVWLLVLQRPESERRGLERVFERIASRDYVYLLALFTIVGRLDLFLWAAGIGAHLFWMLLLWIACGAPEQDAATDGAA